MVVYRSGRLEEKKARKRLVYSILGSIGLLVFLAIFGLKLLVGFSVLVDTLHGSTPTSQGNTVIILAPELDPLPTATNSAHLVVQGRGEERHTIVLYVDDNEQKKTIVAQDGKFSFDLTDLQPGVHKITAKAVDTAQHESSLSNPLMVSIKKTAPKLEVTAPENNAVISTEDNRVMIEGKTEQDTQVTVNGRIVVVESTGAFRYRYPLNMGENKLTVVATDIAGNASTIERTVKYEK